VKLLKNLDKQNLESMISESITKTGLFKRRLINVARKSGALSKYANFSNITLGRLMKTFEGTCIFEESLKDTLRKDLDFENTVKVLNEIGKGEIEVIPLKAGEVSPLAQVVIKSVSMKADIVPPEKLTRIIIESAKARLLNESRVIACMNRKDHYDMLKIRDMPGKLICPRCGSTEIAVFDRGIEEVTREMARERGSSKKKAERWWERGKKTAKLVSMYGRRGAIISAAKKVDFTEAWDILAETNDESDEFFKRIVEAERNALKKRFL
jgi:ATP-dependent Lhr-like helicase